MWKLWDVTRPLTFNRYGYCMGNPVNYVDKSGHLPQAYPLGLGSTEKALNEAYLIGDYFIGNPDRTFAGYAEMRLKQKEEENQKFMDATEDFLTYNLLGQVISFSGSVVTLPITGTAVLARNYALKNTTGEVRDEWSDFYELNTNIIVGAVGSFHSTYQYVSNGFYFVYEAGYIVENIDKIILSEPLAPIINQANAFCAGENRGPARFAGRMIGDTIQAALAYQAVKVCKSEIAQRKAAAACAESGLDAIEKLDDVLSNKTLTNQTSKVDNYVSSIKGDIAAQADFDAMNPTNIRTYSNGTIAGDLPDGRTINIHPSTTLNGTPSVEVYDPVTGKSVKIRY